MTPILIGLYLAAIVAANLLVAALGPAWSPAIAFALISLDLTTRDRLHDAWGGLRGGVWPRMLALILGGGALSYLVSRLAPGGAPPELALRIALASSAAFVASGAADALAYHALRRRPYLQRVNGSNLPGALVDSLLFPALAFGLPLLWPVVLGQLAAKLAGGLLWSVALRPRERAAAAEAAGGA